MLPPAAFAKINTAMGGQLASSGIYLVDCNAASKIKPVTFAFGNVKIILSWDQQLIVDLTLKQCISIFQPLPTGSGVNAILGASWLSNVFSAFDRTNARIGFATPTGKVNITLPSSSVMINGPGLGVLFCAVLSLCLL